MDHSHYMTFMGRGPRQVAHWEHWSCPDAETYLTGIDYYEHPRLCRMKLRELYPQLDLGVPERDDPLPRPSLGATAHGVNEQKQTVRWGAGETDTFVHGEAFFKSPEQVLAFSPLAKGDFTDWPHVVMNWDFRSEEAIYQRLRKQFPAEWGDKAPDQSPASTWFYNTMFMWPMLTFGWELFLECSLMDGFDRVMGEFAEINRRVFRAFARLPVNFIVCHDDIVNTRGPVCSPAWMKRFIFPVYEELWSILRSSGKQVIFMSDGCVDQFVDDVMACGARGIHSEPYTDYRAIARRYDNPVLAGEGDNRILMRNKPDEIKAMVLRMAETARMSGGYLMSVGNHIPWNIPPEAVKCYLDCCAESGCR